MQCENLSEVGKQSGATHVIAQNRLEDDKTGRLQIHTEDFRQNTSNEATTFDFLLLVFHCLQLYVPI